MNFGFQWPFLMKAALGLITAILPIFAIPLVFSTITKAMGTLGAKLSGTGTKALKSARSRGINAAKNSEVARNFRESGEFRKKQAEIRRAKKVGGKAQKRVDERAAAGKPVNEYDKELARRGADVEKAEFDRVMKGYDAANDVLETGDVAAAMNPVTASSQAGTLSAELVSAAKAGDVARTLSAYKNMVARGDVNKANLALENLDVVSVDAMGGKGNRLTFARGLTALKKDDAIGATFGTQMLMAENGAAAKMSFENFAKDTSATGLKQMMNTKIGMPDVITQDKNTFESMGELNVKYGLTGSNAIAFSEDKMALALSNGGFSPEKVKKMNKTITAANAAVIAKEIPVKSFGNLSFSTVEKLRDEMGGGAIGQANLRAAMGTQRTDLLKTENAQILAAVPQDIRTELGV